MSPALMGLEQDAVPLGCWWDSSHGGSGSDPWGCCPDVGDRSPPWLLSRLCPMRGPRGGAVTPPCAGLRHR